MFSLWNRELQLKVSKMMILTAENQLTKSHPHIASVADMAGAWEGTGRIRVEAVRRRRAPGGQPQ